ncbi:hypothetical protein VTI74DRAFT_8799 [Chaetomium olivicolor]
MFSKLFSELKSTVTTTPPQPTPRTRNKAPRPIQTKYLSSPVPIPPDFLTGAPPADARPITVTPVNWASTPLPEYAGLYATVLDHVLSLSECQTLLRLAESSVPAPGEDGSELRHSATDPWGPALVNAGGGFEVLDQEYRNSDRIVWDCQEVVDRIWARCLEGGGEEFRRRFEEIGAGEKDITGLRMEGFREAKWAFHRVNDRMRFLRYGKGGFFKPHCDAPYVDMSDPKRNIRTMFTIHLYLNDSKAEVEGAELVGGATSFFSNDEKRKLDVDPKAGRVLIFQHRRLVHSGDDVRAGTKYSMRTDIMYEFLHKEDEEDKKDNEDAEE